MTRLTIAQAAKRVDRDTRTIERWISAGLPTEKDFRNRTTVDEKQLLIEFRRRLAGRSKWARHALDA